MLVRKIINRFLDLPICSSKLHRIVLIINYSSRLSNRCVFEIDYTVRFSNIPRYSRAVCSDTSSLFCSFSKIAFSERPHSMPISLFLLLFLQLFLRLFLPPSSPVSFPLPPSTYYILLPLLSPVSSKYPHCLRSLIHI